MKTVSEVSRLTGVSVRTLHHYDEIGLLHPAQVTEAGYRLYGDEELERLQMILFFRELKFPLRDVKRILESADFDRNRALEQQRNAAENSAAKFPFKISAKLIIKIFPFIYNRRAGACSRRFKPIYAHFIPAGITLNKANKILNTGGIYAIYYNNIRYSRAVYTARLCFFSPAI